MESPPELTTTPPAALSMDFEATFKTHYEGLHGYACAIIKDPDAAEDVVQNVLFKLWEKRHALPEMQSIASYLYRAVHNDCLNLLKHEKVKAAHQSHSIAMNPGGGSGESSDAKARAAELEKRLAEALAGLPEGCRTIFQLSRFEELKYREIADRLGLSIKTVENQMGKALRILRERLVDFLVLVLFFSPFLNTRQ